jgi:hypothetical protein
MSHPVFLRSISALSCHFHFGLPSCLFLPGYFYRNPNISAMFTTPPLNHIRRLCWKWFYFPPKRWFLPISPHGVTTQKTNIDIFTAVRTSNLMLTCLFFLGEHIGCDLWTPKLLHGKTFTIAALDVSIISVVQTVYRVSHETPSKLWAVIRCMF